MRTFHCLLALLLCALAAPARADLTLVDIFVNNKYAQTSTLPPTTNTGAFFSFGAEMQNAADYNTATASYPPSGVQVLTKSGAAFSYGSPFYPSLAALHAAYPFGTYNITATNTTTLASKTGTINYATDRFTTNIPTVTPASYTALQSYNPANSLTLTHNSFTIGPGTSQGFSVFWIFDALTFTSVYATGLRSPTTTTTLIPAGTLLPNRDYIIEFVYTSRLNVLDTVHNVNTLQGFDVRTNINFRTTSATPIPEPASLFMLFAPAAAALLSPRARLQVPGARRS